MNRTSIAGSLALPAPTSLLGGLLLLLRLARR
jgi:hypothetical protein